MTVLLFYFRSNQSDPDIFDRLKMFLSDTYCVEWDGSQSINWVQDQIDFTLLDNKYMHCQQIEITFVHDQFNREQVAELAKLYGVKLAELQGLLLTMQNS